MERVFLTYGEPLKAFISFRYMGRTFSSTDKDLPAVERSLCRRRKMGTAGKYRGKGGSG